jgi:aminopeptidase YwaD
MKRSIIVVFIFAVTASYSQDIVFAKKMVDTLSSPVFWGRGYTNDGMKKAGDFLAAQFGSYGLKPMDGKQFLQPFTYSVNTFPGKMEVSINGIDLVPGKDFIISQESRGVRGR